MKKHFKLILIGAIIFRLVISFLAWHPDVNSNADWGIRFWQYGPKNFYTQNVWSYTWPNQPPGTIYIYAGVKKLYDFIFSIFWWINVNIPPFPSDVIFYLESNLYPALLKLPSILADVGIAYLIFKIIKDKKVAKFGAIVWLVNPVIWYNSSFWGQTDSVISFFVLLSFFLLQKDKHTLSLLSYAISVYIKASLLIFVPVYLILFLKKKFNWMSIVKSIVFVLLLITILTIPFAKSNPLLWLFNLYNGKIFVNQLQIITANAFNIWTTIATINEKPQTLYLGPLTYQVWGILLFSLSYIILLYKFIKSKSHNLFWILSLVAFSSFMLLTNMHERYLYPLFPFFTILAATNKKLIVAYWTVSLISLLNLYNFWWNPRVEILVNILSFDERIMTRVLGFVMFLLYIYLFRVFLRQTKTSKI